MSHPDQPRTSRGADHDPDTAGPMPLIVPPNPDEQAIRDSDPDLSRTDELVSRGDLLRAHDRPPAPDGELGHRAKSPPQSPLEKRVLAEIGDDDETASGAAAPDENPGRGT